ncbi:hypothetical protein FMZ60_06335 [Alcaligenaceae bacterium SJ-26]|nr:hypothetical protein FMZ60_06335 [Alcaligenaceae bacterium SJ-26]
MDPNSKIDRIKALDDEVKDVHPVLRDLFRLMPNIEQAEYTQGNREMGADFVLHRRDPEIFDLDYIGVIVKSTMIKQDHEDVRRQIRECSVPRVFQGGQRQIHLTEIWVVTSKTITKGAQEAIHNEYKNSKIRWFDADKLVKLIDAHYPDYWTHKDSHYSLYIGQQKERINSHATLHSLIQGGMPHISLEQQIQRYPESVKHRFGGRPSKPTLLLDELLKRRLLFVEGQMGAGKSELLRSTALKMCSDEIISQHGMVPHFVTFREVTEEKIKLKDETERIQKELKDDKITVVYFIDGLDETLQDLEEKVDLICSMAKDALLSERIKMVVSSRKIPDEKISEKIGKSFDKYLICPLSHVGIIKFIEQICTDYSVTNKFRSELQRSPLLKALPRTPLSAILLGKLISEKVKELPSTMPELYSKYTELVLGRWDIQKGSGSEKEYETISRITAQIAAYMFDNDLEFIGRTELRQHFSDYLSQRRTGQDLDNLLRSFLEKDEIIAYDADSDVVHFRHRTFQEYFSAAWTFHNHGKSAQIEDPFSMERGGKEYFYLGLLKDAPERISALRKLILEQDFQRMIRTSMMGSFMMAAYQTPYNEITFAVSDAFIDLAKLYDSVVSTDVPTFLKTLPELQVLALFSYMVKQAYSYEFFRDALRESKFQVDIDEGLTTSVKVIALYLLDCVLADLKDAQAFERLVEYEADMPWAIRLGISCEAQGNKFINNATRHIERRINKSTRNNFKLKEYISQLESVPLERRVKAQKNNM